VIGIALAFREVPLAQLRDSVAETTFREYRTWKRVNVKPVMSEDHSDTWVVTYLNARAAGPALARQFPLPEGAVVVKESFASVNQQPGARGPVYVMEKRGRGYNAPYADWHWAVVEPDGKVSMSGKGANSEETFVCAECHVRARVNDFMYGRGTEMKVAPIPR
jgi:hypothetical protein